jgi:D-alanine--poly(phosphoribitol) ligase subunit 1
MPELHPLVSLLTPRDQQLFQTYGRGPQVTSPFSTIHDAFLYHVGVQPDAVALIDLSLPQKRTLTYRQLAQFAFHLAQKLRALGVTHNVKVPLVGRRSLEFVVGIFGILIAGGQYVPLDAQVAPERTLNTVLHGCGDDPIILITNSARTRFISTIKHHRVIVIDHIIEEVIQTTSLVPDIMTLVSSRADSGCYVIYTSGQPRILL